MAIRETIPIPIPIGGKSCKKTFSSTDLSSVGGFRRPVPTQAGMTQINSNGGQIPSLEPFKPLELIELLELLERFEPFEPLELLSIPS